VTLTRLIPERHRSFVTELVTFGTVGGINTAISMGLFNLFYGLGSLTSSTISTAIAVVFSFVLNRNVTYRHRPKTALRRELPLFTLLNLIGLGIQLGLMATATHVFQLHGSDRLEYNGVRFGTIIVSTVFLLMTYRTFVFKKAPAVPVPAVPAQAVPTHAVLAPVETADEFAVLTEPLEVEFGPAIDEASLRAVDAR
jgi:putative flippase GtrA